MPGLYVLDLIYALYLKYQILPHTGEKFKIIIFFFYKQNSLMFNSFFLNLMFSSSDFAFK